MAASELPITSKDERIFPHKKKIHDFCIIRGFFSASPTRKTIQPRIIFLRKIGSQLAFTCEYFLDVVTKPNKCGSTTLFDQWGLFDPRGSNSGQSPI